MNFSRPCLYFLVPKSGRQGGETVTAALSTSDRSLSWDVVSVKPPSPRLTGGFYNHPEGPLKPHAYCRTLSFQRKP